LRRKKRKKEKSRPASDTQGPAEKQDSQTAAEERADDVKVSGWVESDVEATRKTFPDSGPIDEPVRITVTAEASAEMVSHAKESLEAEVCGVLVGELCQDQQGIWVSVEAAIRGTSAKQGGAHVTYTQETWDKIYEVKDRDYPKLKILGWYHSHPGFGVEFSDMDMFIQRNFFSGPAQLALVLDPVSGDQAVCANAPEGLRHVSRLWVNGRKSACRLPRAEQDESGAAGTQRSADVAQRLKAVEERLQHLLQASDEERMSRHSLRLTVGMLAATAIVLWISFLIYDRVFPSYTPPEEITWSKIPVELKDGKTALLGVRVVSWELPPELRKSFVQGVLKQLEAEAKRLQEEQEKKKKKEKSNKKSTQTPRKAKKKPETKKPET